MITEPLPKWKNSDTAQFHHPNEKPLCRKHSLESRLCSESKPPKAHLGILTLRFSFPPPPLTRSP